MDRIDKQLSKLEFIENFRKELKNRTYKSTITVAVTTAKLLLEIIKAKDLYTNIDELLKLVKLVGKMFISVDIMQFTVGNVVKRILNYIHKEKANSINIVEKKRTTVMSFNNLLILANNKEASELSNRKDVATSVNSITSATTNITPSTSKSSTTINNVLITKDQSNSNNNSNNNNNNQQILLDINSTSNLSNINAGSSSFNNRINKSSLIEKAKEQVIDDIKELIEDLEEASDLIIENASHHINDNDIILTANASDQLHDFLVEAAKKRNFSVLVAESYPSMKGLEMANKLSNSGINTTVISDASIYSVMPKISKVFIGTRAVMANGSLISYNGVYNLCLAAQAYSVPVVVVCGTFKLTPMYPFDHETFNEQLSPDTIYHSKYNGDLSNINFNSPAYDYVPPEFINIFITDKGDYHPTYIYRLFNDYYSQKDFYL